MVGLTKSDLHHAELQKPRISQDEATVREMIETLDNWINSFDIYEEMVSLSTALLATKEISNDLLKANEHGQAAYKKI